MKGKSTLWTASAVYILLGLLLLVFPGLSANLFCTVIGLLLLAYGGVTIASFFIRQGGSFGLQGELIFGVLSALLGLFFLLRRGIILSILPSLLGLYILVDGLVNLKRTLDMRALQYGGWKAGLVFSIISLLLGGIILWNPFATQLLLIRIIGGSFLYQGISDLWANLTLNQLIH